MRLSFLKAAGFRGIKHPLQVAFPKGFAVICGRNGSGKSTVCDAIEFALTGTLERQYAGTEKGETIADYLWWRGTGSPAEPYVSIGFIDDDGTESAIVRGPRGVRGPRAQDLAGMLCEVASDPSQSLQDLCRTSIIRDETITPLSLDLPETDRFHFVRSALSTVDFARIEDKANEVVAHLRQSVAALQAEYEEARRRVTELVSSASEARARASEGVDAVASERSLSDALDLPSRDTADLLARGRSFASELRVRIGGAARLAAALDAIDKRRAQLETPEFVGVATSLQGRLDALRTQLAAVGKRGSDLQARLDDLQGEEAQLSSLTELREHGNRLGLQDGRCPLCGSAVSAKDYHARLEYIRATVEGRNRMLKDLVAARANSGQIERQLRNEIASAEELLKAHLNLAESLRRDRGTVAAELAGLGLRVEQDDVTPAAIVQATETWRRQAFKIESDIAVIEASRAFDRVRELEAQTAVAQREAGAIEVKLATFRRAESRARAAAAAVKRVSGEVVDERLAALSPLLKELYFRLRPHLDWLDVDYHIRGDVRRFLSLKVGPDLNPRFVLSSGQRRVAGLAFLLAVHLSRSWCRLRTLILDDPVQHIDDFRALHLVEVLSAIRQSGRQVICTVEDPALADLLCRRLRSSEDDEGCRVDMQYTATEGIGVSGTRRVGAFAVPLVLSA